MSAYVLGFVGGLFYTLNGALILSLAGAFYNGLRTIQVEEDASPGMGSSLKKAILIGGQIGILGMLLFGGAYWVLFGATFGLSTGLVVGPSLGFFVSLWYAGFDIIQHYILRLFLWYKGYTPPYYADFLDYTAKRIFLRKVGGGYIFIHRLLLEHFAAMGDKE